MRSQTRTGSKLSYPHLIVKLQILNEALDSIFMEAVKKRFGPSPPPISDLLGFYFSDEELAANEKIKATYDRVRTKFARVLDRAVNSLSKGKSDRREFNKTTRAALKDYYRVAFEIGKSITSDDPDATDEELAYLKSEVDDEQTYLRGFAKLIKKVGDEQDHSARSTLYVKALDSVFAAGQVAGLPPNVRVHWRLGEAEHCEDCVQLAMNSPYSPKDLPTIPRAGATVCLSHCKCTLAFE